MRRRRLAVLVVAVACFTTCGRETAPAGPLDIALHPPVGETFPAFLEVTGLSSEELDRLRDARLDEAGWQSILKVTSSGADADMPAVSGKYVVADDALTFTPLFPFDPGRDYRVTLDPARIERAGAVIETTVALPPVATVPSTVLTAIHPSAPVVPENLLRIYIEFSAPMGSSGARDFVRLKEVTGDKEAVVEGAFLPVEADYWSPDHTRYTLFLDPGRVKEGILPNREVGRPLKSGRRYVLEVSPEWTDANRLPLKDGFLHTFRAGPAVQGGIRLADWNLAPPHAGTRDALVTTFPTAIDHAIVARALSVETSGGETISGRAAVEADDTRWTFVPDRPWQPGGYNLVAQSYLEDPQGNQIDHPFEVVVDTTRDEQIPDEYRLAFAIPDAR
jgi:hypothetical protein